MTTTQVDAKRFSSFMRCNGLNSEALLKETLRYVRSTDLTAYNAFAWPMRAATAVQEEPSLYVPLHTKHTEIYSTLLELEDVPKNTVNPYSSKVELDWENVHSLARYAANCWTQYTQQKVTDRLHKDFIICMVSMSYSCAMEALYDASQQGERHPLAAELYLDLKQRIGKSVHNRLIRIGKRSFALLEIFKGLRGLAILGVHKLKTIEKLTVGQFEGFALFLRGQVEQKVDITRYMNGNLIDKKLVYFHSNSLPPQLVPYLPMEHCRNLPTSSRLVDSNRSGSTGTNRYRSTAPYRHRSAGLYRPGPNSKDKGGDNNRRSVTFHLNY